MDLSKSNKNIEKGGSITMKSKDIKERIKNAALSEMPDVFDKIDILKIDIEPKPQKRVLFSFFSMKLVFSSLLLIITAVLMYQLFTRPADQPSYFNQVEALAFQSITAYSLLEYIEDESNPLNLNQSTSIDAKDYLGDMTPLIELSEMIVNQKENIRYNILESDRSQYQFRVRFESVGLDQTSIVYEVYYNEINDEITGIIDTGDIDYPFELKSNRYRLVIDDGSLIEVTEIGTNQYRYRFVRDRIEVFRTEVNMTMQNNRFNAEFSYQNTRGLQIALFVRRNNDEGLDVDYDVREGEQRTQGRFQVTIEDNPGLGKKVYHFLFDDESESTQDKPNRPHINNPGRGPF